MNHKSFDKHWQGFTLIELLVVISIIAILVALSVFGFQGAREASRDSKRKSDLELIRSGLEMYRADCDQYPAGTSIPNPLMGNQAPPARCSTANTYIAEVPEDPKTPQIYRYSSNGTTYELCASLEGGGPQVSCGGSSNCGGEALCNYKVINP